MRINPRSPSSVKSERSASAERLRSQIKVGKYGLALPQNAAGAGVRVLHVEYRVVLALLDHLREVEIERRVVLAHQHHESDSVCANLVNDFTKGHELARNVSTF